MIHSSAFFPTPNASRYLQQICKHFAHKIEVSFDAEQGHGQLADGPFNLRADAEGLHAEVSAEDIRGIIQSRYVVDKHLVTFAFRDGFSGFSWKINE